ncbi:uncharacterized protein VTP21DRAFT_1230 [Calcarisporiella thermophila]|uniref:uncharacterized protein n=1 Tax=Calcarisporiella thermophila TaxID=911321 RepID=UPI0037429261
MSDDIKEDLENRQASSINIHDKTSALKRKATAANPSTRSTLTERKTNVVAKSTNSTTTLRPVTTNAQKNAAAVKSSTGKLPSKTTAKTATSRTTTVKATPKTQDSSIDEIKEEETEEKILEPPRKKKRPAWDTKGRLEDMEELTAFLKQQIKHSNSSVEGMTSKIQELEHFRLSLENKVVVKEQENQDILRKLSTLELELESAELKYRSLQRENEGLTSDLKYTRDELAQQKQENAQLRGTISAQSASSLALESDNRVLKLKIERTEETLREKEVDIEELKQKLAASQELVASLEAKMREEETIRRKLHNTIQELKGNIRVFCRVRPPAETEKEKEGNLAMISFPDQDGREIELAQQSESASGSSISKQYPFSFDKVFQPSATQTDVFEDIAQLVQSALDGYNVCIFAYGQTGSGKTYTMEGPQVISPDTVGVIPRAVYQIFSTAEKLREKGWLYTMEGSFLEIYNETIHDLLGNGDMTKKHEIKHEKNGRTIVTDLTTVVLDSPAKVDSLLKKASQNRAVAATNCNERSSRSHSVFILRLSGRNTITDETCEGVLNLIDLAGSERLSQSGSTGDRLKETQAINKSLSCLGDVIYSLGNKDSHIPYRNSKLTYLLQNSLGGNSKTLMFVNISPLAAHLNETLCSLRFATKVNSCQIGTARRVVSK